MAELKRTMGFWMVAALAFLNLVNTGLFFGVHIGAAATVNGVPAGLNSLVAWLLLAIVSVYTAMCFGELTSMFPSAGGMYEFAKQAYGRFPSFLIGWILWVAGNIATALFTVAAVDFILPEKTYVIMGVALSAYAVKVLVSIGIILILNLIAYLGVEASARFMILLGVFMALVIAFLIYAGLSGMQPAYFTGFSLNISLVLIATFFLSEAFFGWESASYMSEETQDAARVIPRALVATTIAVALAGVLIAVAFVGAVGVQNVINVAPADLTALLLQHLHATPLVLTLVTIGIVVAFLGNVSGNVISLPRLLLALSRDKLFIEQFSDVHPKRQTPYKAIIFQTVVACAIIVFAAASYERLLALLVPVSLLLYASVLVLVPYFRWTRPQHQRHYKAPFGSFLPLLIAALFIGVVVYWAMNNPAAGGELRTLSSFVFFSIPIYLLLTYFYDPDSLIGTLSFFSRINLWLENVLIPKSIRREIIEFFTNARDKHVLEFGSGVGTLTVHLANHVGSRGKIYAVDLSRANVEIIRKRMNKLGHMHVEIIHDPHLVNRVHPDVKGVDIIISINNLGYVQDIRKVLREMNKLLPEQGRVCFVEYVDLFYILPNPKWLSDPERVRQVFREAGFQVKVEVKRGLLWKYMYIYGIKESRELPYI